MNTVTLIGNIGRAPEVRTTKSGRPVASLTVATSYLDAQKQERTDWHNVVVWGDEAYEVAKLKSGDRVIVVGESRARSWEDQSGQKRYTTEVVVSGFNSAIGLAIRRPRSQTSQQVAGQAATSQQPFDKTYDLNDEIPF